GHDLAVDFDAVAVIRIRIDVATVARVELTHHLALRVLERPAAACPSFDEFDLAVGLLPRRGRRAGDIMPGLVFEHLGHGGCPPRRRPAGSQDEATTEQEPGQGPPAT